MTTLFLSLKFMDKSYWFQTSLNFLAWSICRLGREASSGMELLAPWSISLNPWENVPPSCLMYVSVWKRHITMLNTTLLWSALHLRAIVLVLAQIKLSTGEGLLIICMNNPNKLHIKKKLCNYNYCQIQYCKTITTSRKPVSTLPTHYYGSSL